MGRRRAERTVAGMRIRVIPVPEPAATFFLAAQEHENKSLMEEVVSPYVPASAKDHQVWLIEKNGFKQVTVIALLDGAWTE